MSDYDNGDGAKADGAMLAIGELAKRIGVPTHVLRHWETRFPELKPLQRSGRRRYYRAKDVALAEQIYELLHERGFTVEGARKVLAGAEDSAPPSFPAAQTGNNSVEQKVGGVSGVPVQALTALRQRLSTALDALG